MTPEVTVPTDDGLVLGLAMHDPIGVPRAEVLLLHAMMVDARSLDRPRGQGLASTLAERGYRVHRADFRGRGMSARPADWTYDDLVYRDVPALVRSVEARAGQRPFIVGHSLGGHVALASWASGATAVRGMVALGANAWLPTCEPSRRRRLAKRLALGALDATVRLSGRIPARALRIGPVDEAGSYARDLAGFWHRGWRDRGGRDWRADLPNLSGPVLFVTSEGDRLLAHPDGAEAFVRGLRQVERLRLRDGDFGALAPGHMAMGADPTCRPLWHRLADWLDGHA